jgi:hypothetical protein
MRSRVLRLSGGALTCIALGAATVLVLRAETELAGLRARERALDSRAREATDALSGLRVAQQAYVAEGQGAALWAPKVEQLTATTGAALAALRQATTTATALAAVDDAAARLSELTSVDKRARDYLVAGQELMAGDVIFTEGTQEAAAAARQVEAARAAEIGLLGATENAVRRQAAMVLAGAGGLSAFMVLLLGATGGTSHRRAEHTDAAPVVVQSGPTPAAPPSAEAAVQHDAHEAETLSPALRAAAELCTDFGCVQDIGSVQALLARAADAMDAVGLVVWLGSPDGVTLEPVLTHGYADDARARLPTVPRSADNAAAAAFRSGTMQVVFAQPGGPGRSTGAVVAPMLAAAGCVGALSAEIRQGADASEHVQALAAIVASQLAAVLSPAQAGYSASRAAASS